MEKSNIEIRLTSLNRDERVYAILDMLNTIDDPQWIQDQLLILIHDTDFWVAKNAIVALGDLARIHRTLDKFRVLSELEKINIKELKPIIQSAVNDIRIFIRQ